MSRRRLNLRRSFVGKGKTKTLQRINAASLGNNYEDQAEQTRHTFNQIRSNRQEMLNALPRQDYEELAFNLLSTQEAIKMAGGNIISRHFLEGESKINTVYDPRLGSVEDMQCSTCSDFLSCPGHYGLINLAMPFYRPFAMKGIILTLRAVCNTCHNLLMPIEEIREHNFFQLHGIERLQAIAELVIGTSGKGRACTARSGDNTAVNNADSSSGDACQPSKDICDINPHYHLQKSITSYLVQYNMNREDTRKKMASLIKPIAEVWKILNCITDKNARLLGFTGSHPRDFIMEVLLVIPPCSRPNAYVDGNLMVNPLSSTYNQIVRVNNDLQAKINQAEDISREQRTLQGLINGLLWQSQLPTGRGQNKTEIPSLMSRIGQKKGIFRTYSLARRTDQTARTVIAINPDLKFGQVSVPRSFAKFLTKRVSITNFNIDWVKELWRVGQIENITFGKRAGPALHGRSIKVTAEKRSMYQPRVGDVVDRWLQEGDRIILNRQPTLHRFGFVTASVVFSSDTSTIGFSEAMAQPYNADFDGDEMNLSVPQGPEAEVEMRYLMAMEALLLNPANSRPVAGPSFDPLLGAYMLTQDEQYEDPETGVTLYRPRILPKGLYYNLINNLIADDSSIDFDIRREIHAVSEYSAKALISRMLPADFNYQYNNIVIQDGIFISGKLDKKSIGFGRGSILHWIIYDYGPERASDFITDVEHTMIAWMNTMAISVGLEDISPSDPKIQEVISERRAEILQIVETLYQQKPRNAMEAERLEEEISKHLQNMLGVGAAIVDKFLAGNNVLALASLSGAKGSTANTSLIMAGSQVLHRGKRFKSDPSGQKLPYFPPTEEAHVLASPAEGGFTSTGFVQGLNPAAYFFRGQAGREGLANTAITTSTTGYIRNQLFRFMEDLILTAHGDVETQLGNIVQFLYADGFDARYLLKVTLPRTGSSAYTVKLFADVIRLAENINHEMGF